MGQRRGPDHRQHRHHLKPLGSATRAEVATILMRFLESVA